MALNPETKYPGRITPSDANYDYGSSKDETAPGAGDGTPYEKARANDVFGLQQALLKTSGIVPSGNADTQLASQYLQSLVELAMGRATNYDDSGVADAYVLDVQTDQQAPASLFDGQIFEFIAGNTNAGASTVNPVGLGIKNIVGTSSAGTITAGNRIKIRYRLGTTDFEIISIPTIETIIKAKKAADESVTNSTTLQDDDDLTVTLEADSVYSFESELVIFTTSVTPDIKYEWIEPDGTYHFSTSIGGTDAAVITHTGVYDTRGPVSQALAANFLRYLRFAGIVRTGGSGGTFKLQWAQNISDATAVTIQAGSFMRLIKQ